MLGKYGVTGGVISRSYETVYLGDTPIAVATGANASPTLYRVYPDHLDAPRAIARNTTGAIVWRWDSNPFGADLPNEDVDGDGQKLSFSLRFPGQYYDAETGLMQNGMRDYNPGIGRYMQSDPIGLEGGINTYGYVDQNPINWTDSTGLEKNRDLGKGYMGRLDQFPGAGGQASFEIHVYKGDMNSQNEVGIYGPNGWVNKHGKGIPVIPECVTGQLQNWSTDWLTRAGLLPSGKILNSLGSALTILDFLVQMQRAKELGTDPFSLMIQESGFYGPNSI